MRRHPAILVALLALFTLALLGARFRDQSTNTAVTFCAGKKTCAGKYSSLVQNIKVLQQSGARPHFSPDGKEIVFDRKNTDDGYADVYVMDLSGKNVRSLTDNNSGINQRNNGNAVFAPSGKYIVFQSEEQNHFGSQVTYLGDPGLGDFSNLWATDPQGKHFWKLTNIPIKQSYSDPTPLMGVLNPVFSPDGSKLIWSEHYADGGHFHWGKWRIEMADFSVSSNGPSLTNETTVFTPTQGNYVTAMGLISSTKLLLSGNLDGQMEYGMDQYLYDMKTKKLVNLQHSPKIWEEGATVTPHGHIVYMTNFESKDHYNFNSADWTHQPMQREYWMMDFNGNHKTRITYFNDPKAPEYLKRDVIVAAMDVSPDGKYLVGTLGVNFGTSSRADNILKIVLIQFKKPI